MDLHTTGKIQQIALDLIKENISKECWIHFDDSWYSFNHDLSGQRGHYIVPYKGYGAIIEDHYLIKRALMFVNQGDEGKEGAILGILNLKKYKVTAIKKNKIKFLNFTFYFKDNPCTRSMNFVYE